MAARAHGPTDLVEMAHPDLPKAPPIRVTRRQLSLVWEARGWRETSGKAQPSPTDTPESAPVASETAAPRRKTPAAEAASKEN